MLRDTSNLDSRTLLIIGRGESTEGADDVLSVGDLRRAWVVLGLRDLETRARLQSAILIAIDQGVSDLVVVEEGEDERSILTVRPAREPGRAVVARESLQSGATGLDADRLRDLFTLSQSEAAVALGVARGASLCEIAQLRGVQHETVRGQVKTLMRKIGVNSQKQLTATLSHVGALWNLTQARSAVVLGV